MACAWLVPGSPVGPRAEHNLSSTVLPGADAQCAVPFVNVLVTMAVLPRRRRDLYQLRARNNVSLDHAMLPTDTARAGRTLWSTLVLSLQPEFFGIKRSERSRRPSARKIESDEYEASSRGSSRPPTPSTRTPKPKSKKRPHGERGNRAGHIVQPSQPRKAGNEFSPEPTPTPGSPPSNPSLAQINVKNRSKAIHYSTDFLGSDTSHLSTRMLQRILDSRSAYTELTQAGPMETTGGSAPAIMQSAKQVVLGSGHPPLPTTTSNPQFTSQSSSQPGTRIPATPRHSTTDVGVDSGNDTATESESEPEFVEVGPNDSISQCLTRPTLVRTASPAATTYNSTPNVPNPIAPLPPHVPVAVTMQDRGISPSLFTPYHSDRADLITSALPTDPETMSVDESAPKTEANPEYVSDSDSDSDSAPTPKRLRLASPLNSKSHIVYTGRSLSHQGSQSRAKGREHNPDPNPNPLLQPPSPSDVSAILSWALNMAQQAGTSSAMANGADPATQPGKTFGLFAKVIEGLQAQLATFNLANSDPRSQQPSTVPGDMEVVEDDAERRDAAARRNFGKHVGSKRKVTLDDFPGINRRIASLAIPELLAMTFTRGPYEVNATIVDWGYEAFKLVSCRLQPGEPYQKPPRELIQLMVHRASWYHGELKKYIRGKIETEYGFINPPQTHEERRTNRQLAKRLKPNAFHCFGLVPDINAYEHPAVRKCIAVGYFNRPDSIGMQFHERFRRLPLPAVATILTIMQHCIGEWKTGCFISRELNAGQQLKVYEAHLKGLLEYARPAPKRLLRFRREWFWFGVAYSGVPLGEEQPVQPITRADRVRPDTPAPGGVA
ncbi:hypothetical protein FRC11_011595 [Ceratobasidium sp. 423]|nr:hypothetical protein FRC11_011595 [Ceratobasidium sp. 423]